MDLINHYSILWGGVIILGVAAFFILRKGYQPKKGLVLLGLAGLLLVGWLAIRPQQANTNEYNQYQGELGQGQAVLLELQSPYWLACAAAKPIVNGLQVEFPDQLLLLSVDVQSSLGRELTQEYGRFTPTFIFFDQDGEEEWRAVGTLDPDKVRQSLQ